MVTLLTIVHISVCFFLIVIVLLQHGKGADMGASFGGGSGQTVFGTEGPLPLLNKITTTGAIVFMITSVSLAYYSANTSKSSVMKSMRITAPIEQQVDIAPTPVEVPMIPETQVPSEGKTDPTAQFPGAKSTDTPAAAPQTQEVKIPAESQPKEAAPAQKQEQ